MYPPLVSPTPDWSGNSNDGTIFGATWKRLGSGLWYLDFDGVNDEVTTGSDASVLTNGCTFKVWMRLDAIPAGGANIRQILAKGTAGNYGLVYMGPAYGNLVAMSALSATATKQARIAFTADSIWHQWIGTWNGTRNTLYKDGGSAVTSTVDDTWTDATAAFYIMGVPASTRWLDGGATLLEVLAGTIWTADQVANSFNQERHLFGV